MNPTDEKNELTDKIAVALSRLHQLLLVEKEAIRNLDCKRIDELEAEIALVLEEKDALVKQFRNTQQDSS